MSSLYVDEEDDYCEYCDSSDEEEAVAECDCGRKLCEYHIWGEDMCKRCFYDREEERADGFKQLTVGDVKRFVRDSQVIDSLELSRKELLKFLMNENEVGEGNQFLHSDDTLYLDVYNEIRGEDSSYRAVLASVIPSWRPEDA